MNFAEQCREVWELWKRKLAIVATVAVASVTFYHVIFGANGWMVYQKKKAEYHRVQQEIQQLQSENDTLQRDIKALKSDPQAIEREAREQLHLTRPGEVVYVLPAPKSAPSTQTATGTKKH